MMNQEIKKKWIDALRSGRYVQGVGKLRKMDNTFCCLGVLCDIVNPHGWRLEEGEYYYGYTMGVLSDSVRKTTGLMNNPKIKNRHLTDWNDADRKNFNEIADLIEESDL